MKAVIIYASPLLAKEIVIASMQNKDIDLLGMLTQNIVQADGQKTVSSFYRNLETRISINDFTTNKEKYLKKNPDAKYHGIIFKPNFNICEEISKQLKLNRGCITFTTWYDVN